MDDFLDYLAADKYKYYHFFYYRQPNGASSTEDCVKRMEMSTRYYHLLELINVLPNDAKKKVEDRFNELKGE